VAAALKDSLQLDSELTIGPSGCFEVAVNGKVVAWKASFSFPTEKEIIEAVSRELGR
jgi:hypothetical protein